MDSTQSQRATAQRPVRLSLHEEVLILSVEPGVLFEQLRLAIRELLQEEGLPLEGMELRLDLGNRPLDQFEVRRLGHLLKEEFGIHLAGLYCSPENIQRFAERELKLTFYSYPAEDSEDAIPITLLPDLIEEEEDTDEVPDEEPSLPAIRGPQPELVPHEQRAERSGPSLEGLLPVPSQAETDLRVDGLLSPVEEGDRDASLMPALMAAEMDRLHLIHRSLRSGQRVQFQGHVAIFGDVNPGAEIIATGNIFIFGSLKGMAHAGVEGDEAILVSFSFQAMQLRIGDKIVIPPIEVSRARGRPFEPVMARIDGDQIVIEPFKGKLL